MSVRVQYEVKSGGWPNNIGIVREALLSNDLSVIKERRVIGIKVYDREEVVLNLPVAAAEGFAERLATALIDAGSGPLGDLEAPEPDAAHLEQPEANQ